MNPDYNYLLQFYLLQRKFYNGEFYPKEMNCIGFSDCIHGNICSIGVILIYQYETQKQQISTTIDFRLRNYYNCAAILLG